MSCINNNLQCPDPDFGYPHSERQKQDPHSTKSLIPDTPSERKANAYRTISAPSGPPMGSFLKVKAVSGYTEPEAMRYPSSSCAPLKKDGTAWTQDAAPRQTKEN